MLNQKTLLTVCLLLALPDVMMAGPIKCDLHLTLTHGQPELVMMIIAIGTFFAFGFQMANVEDDLSDEEIGPGTRGHISFLRKLGKDVETETLTSSWLQNNTYSDENLTIKETLDLNLRQEAINRLKWNDKEANILGKEYGLLAKSLQSKNVVYEPPINPALKFVLDEIIETTNTVNEFDPTSQVWTAKYEWIWRAVSNGKADSDRENWANSFFKGLEDQKPRFYAELDKLAAAYATKVHLLTPGDDLFAYHNEADESLMKEQISKDVRMHNIGIEYKDWEVQWDESKHEKTPEKRFKRAFIFADPNDGTGYSRLYQINLIQDYQGDGKYSETSAKYLNSWPRSGPGKKLKANATKSESKTKSDPKSKPEKKSKPKSK